MIKINEKKKCCGCNACGDICVHKAISFTVDKEGFWYPIIDVTKCNDCGLCEKICPIINAGRLKKNDLEQAVCYAAEHRNISVVFDSTSGGLFSALADIMYREKGYVGGAVFEEDFSVSHYVSGDKSDLPKLRSSKYAQSDLSGFFGQVKCLLNEGEKVLVCGCPCQMVALRAFLQGDYDNLVIIDFICRGINSPKVWRKYLDSFEERYGFPVIYAKAKSKEYGWRALTQKVVLANGGTYYETRTESNFTKGYLHTNAYCRPSCYDCQFKGFPRMADITLGDYWGIEKINKTMDKNLGVSAVIINSRKGLSYFEKIRQRINCIQTPLASVILGNPALVRSLGSPLVDRKLFFEDLDKMTFSDVASRYINETRKQIIKRWIKTTALAVVQIIRGTRLRVKPMYQLLRYNSIRNIIRRQFLLPAPYCLIEIDKSAHVKIGGVFRLGSKKFRRSRLETRLSVGHGATLEVGGDFSILYGADIEVFRGATLKIGGREKERSSGTNINCTIICGERIEIGKDVQIGRNVTIRDNNGEHYLNMSGYRNSSPIIIEDKVWLCEGCTIMSGVRIGKGAVIGANAFVTHDVPAYTLVMGNPMRVRAENVLWKY